MKRLAALIGLIAVVLLSSREIRSAHFNQTDADGCRTLRWRSDDLWPHQTGSFYGGKCGGAIIGEITFSGNIAKENKGSASLRIVLEHGLGRVCEPSSITAVRGVSGNFMLRCEVERTLAPYDSTLITVGYDTNHVRNDPLPQLHIALTYYPGQAPYLKVPSAPAPQAQPRPPSSPQSGGSGGSSSGGGSSNAGGPNGYLCYADPPQGSAASTCAGSIAYLCNSGSLAGTYRISYEQYIAPFNSVRKFKTVTAPANAIVGHGAAFIGSTQYFYGGACRSMGYKIEGPE